MPQMSIGRSATFHADADPDRPALTCGDVTLSRAEFERRANRLARAFAELGVKPDDLVTIALPNSIEFIVSIFALWKLGATPQPVSARLPGRELQEIIALANSSLVIGVNEDQAPGRATVPVGYIPSEALSDAPLEDRTATHFKAPTSGGSTGRPKIILSTLPGAFNTDDPGFFVPSESVVLIPGVLYHNGPFAVSTMAMIGGSHLIIMPRFDAAELLSLIERYRPTYLYLVPTMMQRVWMLPEEERQAADLSSIKIAVHMAAPCAPWLKEAWINWLGADILCEIYGGTEQQALTWITGEEWLQHRGSVGKPFSGQIKIVGEDGSELAPGEIGDLYMKADNGPGSTYRYIGAESTSVGEWETIGDMGWIDEEGYVYLADRRKDLILRGGANIYPAEVEAALDEHPAVRSSAVIGLPDADMGQVVHAIVDAPGGIDEAELRAYVVERLIGYKCPATYEFVDELLRDDGGKVRRSQLVEERLGGG